MLRTTIESQHRTEEKKHYSQKQRRYYVDLWRNSHQSMSEFCREYDLNISTFHRWAQLLKEPKDTLSFKAVQSIPPEISAPPVVKEITKEPKVLEPTECFNIEVTLINSVKININNIRQLSSVSKLIKELQSCN